MDGLGDFVVLIIIGVIWAIGQLARAGGRRREAERNRQAPAPRQPSTARAPKSSPREEPAAITLEEWMERVRRGDVPQGPTTTTTRQRDEPTSQPHGSAADVLRQWEERTHQPQESRRSQPAAQPHPKDREEHDPYATPRERVQRAQEAARAQAEALAQERDRERHMLQQRKAERRRRQQARARRAARGAKRVAIPRPPPERTAVPERARAPQPVVGDAYAQTHADAYAQAHPDPDAYKERERGLADARGVVTTRAGLRQGILMAEILGPPVALRQRGRAGPYERDASGI